MGVSDPLQGWRLYVSACGAATQSMRSRSEYPERSLKILTAAPSPRMAQSSPPDTRKIHGEEAMTHQADTTQDFRRSVETPSGRINYVERGTGPAALFIHGVLLN